MRAWKVSVMSQAVLFMALAVFSPAGSVETSAAGKPGAAGELDAVLNEETRAALREGLRDGCFISPEEAMRAAHAFLPDRGARFQLTTFADSHEAGFGGYFALKVTGLNDRDIPESMNLVLSAVDGKPLSLQRFEDTGPEGPAIVSRSQAATIAERFLRRRWPEFVRRKWVQDYLPFGEEESPNFMFGWTEVLGEHQVRAAHDLLVHVEKSTGRVVESCFPRDPLCYSVVPRVTIEQAKRLAGPLAPVDPAVYPFDQATLRLIEGDHGIVALFWMLSQDVPEEVRAKLPTTGYVRLNAMTAGDPWTLYPYVSDEPWRRAARTLARETYRQLAGPEVLPIHLFLSAARPVTTLADPELREGEVWLRIEVLRDCQVRVLGLPRRPVLRFRNRRVPAEELGARWRDYAWWIPLGPVARAFGWKVRRDNQTNWVHIDIPEPR